LDDRTLSEPGRGLGVSSGAGLVIANMIGAGGFLSTGFMAQELGPGPILLAWVTGAVIALLGVRVYSEAARLAPRSGGEYRYLSDLWHPALGYLAGWASFLVGFSAPIAISALGAGHFLVAMGARVPPRLTAATVIVTLTVVHSLGFQPSRWTQDVLVAFKGALLVAFVVIGISYAGFAWPSWTPPRPAPSVWPSFMTGLFFVAFAFSGWNAATYAAGEFKDPARTVPRAMLLGCALVALLYLAVNWVFVTGLTPQRAAVVMVYESARITLGHLILEDILGPRGAAAMSFLFIVAFISSVSAMIFVGPRVYAAMASDGFLPRRLSGPGGGPTASATVLQGTVALVLLFTQRMQEVLMNVGALLTLFAALVALAVLRVRLARPDLPAPGWDALAAAAAFAGIAGWMLYFGLRDSATLLAWTSAIAAAALTFYLWTRGRRRRTEGL
jgi:APA family basic amino acid/polyamine antiporter